MTVSGSDLPAASDRPALVIFSPMPPSQSGIAHYTATLLPSLQRHYRCTVVVDDRAEAPAGMGADVSVIRDHQYRADRIAWQTQRHLFHVGNNGDHVYMLPHLIGRSGIIVLHDPSLHYLLDLAAFHDDADRRRYRDVFWSENGPQGRLLALQALERGWSTDATHTDLPALATALSRASGVIVHSAFAERRVGRAFPDLPTAIVEHFAAAAGPDRLSRRILARQRLGIPLSQRLIMTLGFVTRAKQLPQLLDAISYMRADMPDLFCIIAGRDTYDALPMTTEIARRGLGTMTKHLGYISEEEINDYLDACDLLVNLRLPTQGETSGSVSRALGRGVCVLVNDNGWFAELPDDAVVKVPPVVSPELLAGYVWTYLGDPGRRAAVERAAAAYARETLGIERITQRYRAAIERMHAPDTQDTPSRQPGPPVFSPPARADRLTRLREQIAASALDPGHPDYLGTLWWLEGCHPVDARPEDVVHCGPPSLPDALGIVLAEGASRPARAERRFGLFAGSLPDLLFGAPDLLGRVVSKLSIGESCIVNVWDDRPVADTLAQLDEVLPRLGLEAVRIVRGDDMPVELVLGRPIPFGECCVIAAKRAPAECPVGLTRA